MTKKKVVVFGTAQVGKSSLIAQLCCILTSTEVQKDRIRVGGGAQGCTTAVQKYETDEFIYYDTAGLDECRDGTVPFESAIQLLVQLLQRLRSGLHLFVWVTRKGVIRASDQDNFKFFVEILAQNRVPCIGIVLGCEVDEPITQYESQLSVYQDRGIDLAALCAGTAVPISAIAPPMQATIQQRFNDSRDRFLQAIRTHSTESTVLLYETEMGLAKLIKNAWNHLVLFLGLGGKLSAISEPLWDLLKRLRVSDEIAIEMAVKVQG
eukprot:m.263118 g.263118  ORF g.263118 m.263118 type:complete len:265 (+) comp19706_c0_seq16:210-1004(+)